MSPGATKLWVEPPFVFRARVPARIDVTKDANTGNGTCREDNREPALPGIRVGDTGWPAPRSTPPAGRHLHAHGPDGTLVATYTHPNAANAKLAIANEVHCLLTAGSTAFAKNDAFTIAVVPRPTPLVITPRPAGQPGYRHLRARRAPGSPARASASTPCGA